jgi:hypothetical protein
MGCSHNGAQCFSLLWLPKKQAKALRPKDPYISMNETPSIKPKLSDY